MKLSLTFRVLHTFISFKDTLTLSCIYSKSITVNMDMESRTINEQYKHEKIGQLHYDANFTYHETKPYPRTIVVLDPKHKLKLTPRYFL